MSNKQLCPQIIANLRYIEGKRAAAFNEIEALWKEISDLESEARSIAAQLRNIEILAAAAESLAKNRILKRLLETFGVTSVNQARSKADRSSRALRDEAAKKRGKIFELRSLINEYKREEWHLNENLHDAGCL